MKTANTCTSVAATSPGGFAQQFRVQYLSEQDHNWRLHAAFRSRKLAEASLTELEKRGLRARVIAYNRCPVAS